MKFFGEELTVQRVKDSYLMVGRKPKTQGWIGADSCCALSAVMLASGKTDPDSLWKLKGVALCVAADTIAKAADCLPSDVCAFIDGFDGVPDSDHLGTPEHKLGVEVRNAIL